MRVKLVTALIALTLLLLSAGLAKHYRDNYRQVKQHNTELEKTLAQQAGLIATMQEQDARNRKLMAVQQQREQQLRQRGEIYQRKFKDAIKNDECSRRNAPGGVLDLLRGTDTNAASANRSVTP